MSIYSTINTDVMYAAFMQLMSIVDVCFCHCNPLTSWSKGWWPKDH